MAASKEQTVSVWSDKVHPTVKISGGGAPLVYLHGGYGPIETELVDELAKNFTVYAVPHPGLTPGDEDAIKALDDFWDLVLYYYDLFDKLGLKSPMVVGHSFGGMVAAEVAATDPTRVSKLALIAPFGLWRDDAPIPLVSSLPSPEVAKRIFHPADHPASRLVFPNRNDTDAVIRVT